MLQLLTERYGEAPVALGLSHSGAVVELYSTRNGETWTITVTFPDGRMCALAAGEDWTPIIQTEGAGQ